MRVRREGAYALKPDRGTIVYAKPSRQTVFTR
jgi:hypothetical protein